MIKIWFLNPKSNSSIHNQILVDLFIQNEIKLLNTGKYESEWFDQSAPPLWIKQVFILISRQAVTGDWNVKSDDKIGAGENCGILNRIAEYKL